MWPDISYAGAMLIALGLDLLLGWPATLFARIGHPVTWIGAAISFLDRALNHERHRPYVRRLAGVFSLFAIMALVGAVALSISALLPNGWAGTVLTGVLAWPFVALRSMHDHVQAVCRPLQTGDLPKARAEVAMIVGRDPSQLDGAGVARATLESLAENSSDGIVAPVFWGALLGLPGIALYKAVNTLDSMIGHRSVRHEAFGWASARFDDLVNLAPARLTGVLFALSSAHRTRALNVMFRDAPHHRSPNAGWPEAAMAGALNVRLSGPRTYGDHIAHEPWVNDGTAEPNAADVAQGLALYRTTMGIGAGLLGILALMGW